MAGTLKEAFAAVLAGLQSLAQNDSRETPVDRLGALAYAQHESELASLGVDLIALKFAHREASRGPAALNLACVLAWKRNRLDLSANECLKVARWAIGEWLNQNCIACRGAKESPAQTGVEGPQRMTLCPTCSGSGLRIWSDQERSDGLGGQYDKPLDIAHKYIGAAEAQAVRRGREMLERWP